LGVCQVFAVLHDFEILAPISGRSSNTPRVIKNEIHQPVLLFLDEIKTAGKRSTGCFNVSR
jgi:hypothetical protein